MNILFVANRVPFPPYRGDKLKIFNLAKQLHQKFNLYLITFAETDEEMTYVNDLKPFFKDILFVRQKKLNSYINVICALWSKNPFQIAYFKNNAFKSYISEMIFKNNIDLLYVQHLRMAQFTNDFQIPKILDLPDAFSLYWKRRIANSKNIFVKIAKTIESKRLWKYENNMLKRFNLVLACSREDIAYLKSNHQIDNMRLLKNGVDLEQFKNLNIYQYQQDTIILFTGNMDYAPNVDAVQYFCKSIFPIILQELKHVKFVIAGQRPVKEVLALASKNVEVTGFIKNLVDVYSQASIVVAPLRFGAGTQNKVLEAMAMGIPVVSGKIGFEGLEISQGEGVFCIENEQMYAKQCIALLKDENLRKQTGTKGFELSKKFGWTYISQELGTIFQEFSK